MSFDDYKNQFIAHKAVVTDLDDFLFLLQRTDDTEILKRFFNKIITHINKDSDLPAAIASFYSALPSENRYVFLTMIREHYADKHYGNLSDNRKDISHLPNALAAMERTNVAMETKTKWQSRGMMLGGVTFGMEVVMLALERVTWSEQLDNPQAVLALIFAGFLILGYPMGRFFKSAHHDALLKQNKENFFEAQYGQEMGKNPLVLFSQRMRERPGYAIAAFGVLAEGLLIFRGILSGTGFTLDMATLCATGDDYANKLPGTYFMDTYPEAGGILCAVSVLFALAVSYSLMSGHFALDGREACEHEAKKTANRPA